MLTLEVDFTLSDSQALTDLLSLSFHHSVSNFSFSCDFIAYYHYLIISQFYYSMIALYKIGLLLSIILLANSVCWNTVSQVRMGTIQPIIQLTASTTTTTSLTTPFTSAFGAGAVVSWALGVTDYNAYLTAYFSFNSTVNHIDRTGISITVQPGDGSYFVQLKLRYLVTQFTTSSTPRMQLVFGCFKCLSINSGWGDRSQTFYQNATITNGSGIVTNSYLYAWNFSNTVGEVDYVKIQTWIDGLQYRHVVSTKENVSLSSVCLSTVTYDTSNDNPGNGIGTFFEEYRLTPIVLTLYVYYWDIFDCNYVGFFGFTMIHHTRGSNRVLAVYPDDYLQFSARFAYNQYFQQATLKIFYIGQLSCNLTNDEMYQPLSYSCVQNCSTLYANDSNVCVPCSNACADCDPQNSTNCTSCSDATRTGVDCACMSGYFDPGFSSVCEQCSDYMNNCTTCQNSSYCLGCDTGLYLINGSCQCSNSGLKSYLINNICLLFPGCVDPGGALNAVYCNECNSTANFELVSISNLTCVCITGYNNVADPKVCTSVCGDGLVDAGGCDDNNLVDGDGCSSNCTVETGWYCSVDSGTTGPSKCVPEQSISISYLYAYRESGTNTAEIYFELSPSGLNISSGALSSGKVTTNVSTSGDITAVYDPSSSRIIVTLQFAEDMEGNFYYFDFDFTDVKAFYANMVTSTATTEGINEELIMIDMVILVKSVLYTLMALSIIALILGIISSVAGHKLAGLELVFAIQAGYFGFMSMTSPQTFMTGMKGLQLSNGWGQLMAYDYQSNYKIQSKLPKFQYQIQFLLNVNIMLGITIISSIIFLILQLCYFSNYQKAYNQQIKIVSEDNEVKKGNKKKEEKKVFEVKEQGQTGQSMRNARQNRNNYLNHFFFFMLALLVQQCLFAFITQNMQTKMGAQYFQESLNVLVSYLGLLFVAGTFIFMLSQLLEKRDKRVLVFQETKLLKYPFFLLFFYMVFAVGVGLTYTFQFAIYIALILSIFPLLIFIILRPYQKSDFTIDFVSALSDHITPILIMLVFLANQVIQLQEMGQLISVSVVIVAIIAIQVLTIIRLVRTVAWRELWLVKKCTKKERKKEKRVEAQFADKNEVEMSMLVKQNIINEQKMVDWEERNLKEFESMHSRRSKVQKMEKVSEREEEEHEEQEEQRSEEEVDELALLKQRLKKQIAMKRSAL